MPLYRAGIRVSEGGLAERANTSPLQGTAPYALARAVDSVARSHGRRAGIERMGYGQAMRLERPFVAFVTRPGVGHHALLVLKVEPDRVQVIDPLSGDPDGLSRDEFLTEWDSLGLWVEESGGL